MRRVASFLSGALRDGAGLPSAIRLHLFLTLLFAGIVPVVVWLVVCVAKRELVDIPAGVATFCGLLIGSSTAAKAAQSFSE